MLLLSIVARLWYCHDDIGAVRCILSQPCHGHSVNSTHGSLRLIMKFNNLYSHTFPCIINCSNFKAIRAPLIILNALFVCYCIVLHYFWIFCDFDFWTFCFIFPALLFFYVERKENQFWKEKWLYSPYCK